MVAQKSKYCTNGLFSKSRNIEPMATSREDQILNQWQVSETSGWLNQLHVLTAEFKLKNKSQKHKKWCICRFLKSPDSDLKSKAGLTATRQVLEVSN